MLLIVVDKLIKMMNMDFKFYFKISIDILIDGFNYWLLLINDDKVFNIDFTFYFIYLNIIIIKNEYRFI